MLGVKRLGLIAGLVVLGLAPAAAAQGAAQPSAQDTQFLQTIHQVNLTEIADGNMAQQKATDQQVKDLAARFVTDHTQLDQAVQSAASQAGVTLPGAPTPDQQAVLDHLQSLSGRDFDTQWVSAELTMHTQAQQAAETEVAQGTDNAVKQVAQTALPVLQAHIDALTALAQTLGIPVTGGTGSASPSGTPSPGATTESPLPGATTEAPLPGGPTETPSPTSS